MPGAYAGPCLVSPVRVSGFLRLYRAGGSPEPGALVSPSSLASPPAVLLGGEVSRKEVFRLFVPIGSMVVGAARPILIAGPCSVETNFVEHAVAVAATGVDGLRACVFKPRTHPDSFQGLGAAALPFLIEVRRRITQPLISEVLAAKDAELLVDYVDAFQVGARNMQNFRLLETLGEMKRPVIVKRGLAATIDEWIAASEYLRRRGNDLVILCERGIRSFEPRTRSTLDLSSVVIARGLTDLPIIVDPSHAAGHRDLVLPLARAALAVGADGLLVEAHPEPHNAWSDADQTLDLDALATLVEDVARESASRVSALEFARSKSEPRPVEVA